MADDGWDVSEAITTATPVAAPHAASNDGWDVSDAVTPIGPPTTSAYEAAGGRSTWGDVLQGVKAGARSTIADTAGAVAAVQEPGAARTATQSFALGQQEAAHQDEQGMTPAAQAPGFFKHPLVSTAEAAPGIVALGAPAALAGPFAPLVVGGLMGAQQLGEAQNRATGQGYELTPGQKLTQFGIGAATGLVPELGLPGKIVTTPLVDRALGIGEGAVTFGAGAAGGEAASQQSEIGAGKRTGYDPSAIISAGEEQAGVGAAFKLVHGSGAKSQTGGEGRGGRRTPEQAASESKRTDGSTRPVDMTQQPGVSDSTTGPYSYDPSAPGAKEDAAGGASPVVSTAPPPPPPKVDPAQEAALKPETANPPGNQPPVVQPKPEVAIQPEAQPISRGVGEPPAGDTTQPPPTPQPTQEVRPTPVPAPPREDVGAIVPESAATLAEQHAALLDPDNPREAMIYPKGAQVLDIPNKSFGQARLPDGRIVQFDKSGPSGLSVAKIIQYAKDDRLNEALQLGPFSKDEALSRTLAGEPGAVVTERTPEGVEAKAAAGTTATVPAQAEALEATKTPGNVIGVERPEDTLAARQADVAQQEVAQPQTPVVQPEVASTPEPVTLGVSPGRVLEAQDPESIRARDAAAVQDALQVRTVEDQLKAKEAARQQAAAEEAGAKAEAKRLHSAKADQEKVAKANAAAEKIVADHPHTGSYADVNALTARVKAMARAAGAEGIDVPKVFAEGHPWNAAMIKLREAKDMLAPIKKELGETREDKLGRFIDREHMLDSGRVQDALAARRAEAARGQGSPEGATEVGVRKRKEGARADADEAAEQTGEHIVPTEAGEEHAIAETVGAHEEGATELPTEYTHEGGGGDEEEAKPINALAAAREERERKIAAARAESEAMRREAPPSKAAMGFQVAKVKNRTIKRSMEVGEREGEEEHPEQVMIEDKDGNLVGVTPTRTSTAEDAIAEHYDRDAYDKDQHKINQHVIGKINKIAGDTPVHYLSKADMAKHFGKGTLGVYSPNIHHYLLAEGVKQEVAFHEAFHAATTKAMQDSPELQDLITRLGNEVLDGKEYQNLSDEEKNLIAYPMSDAEEFITGVMTNPHMQKFLKSVKISDQLARDIGIPKWRKMTAWHGILHIFQKALGLEPRDVSVIEAAASLSEQAMWMHRRGAGDLMEAQGRYINSAREAAPKTSVSLYKSKFSREAPPERDQEAYFKSPSEKIAQVKNIDKEMVRQYTKDKAGNLATSAIRQTARFLSGTQLSDLHGKIFTDAKGNILEAINNARNRVVSTFNTLRTGDRDLINRGYILDQKYASRMGDYAELLNLSSRFNIHAEREAPMAPKNPVDAPRKNWQVKAQGDRARALYRSLPVELQKHYTAEKQYYRDKQQELAKTVLDKTLPILDLPKDMEERVRNNDLTDDDWEKLEDMHAANAIRNAQRLINKKDVYFPGGRGDGRWVVTGRYEMPKGGSTTDATGKDLADNKREFDTEQAAHDYVTSTHMPASVRETTYHTENGVTQRVKPDEAATTGKIDKKYEVSLERQHTEMHDSYSDAAKARAEMEKAGVGELSGGLDKRNERAGSSIRSREQQALERRIMNRDNLTSNEKQHLIDSTRQLALGSQSGMSPHLLQSRKVAGAKFNNGEGLDSYSRAINQHIARNSHSTDLNQAMQRLDEHENATRSDSDSTTRSIIANTMRDRVYDPSTRGVGSKVPPFLHKLITMSFINFLVRPSHIFLSQVHPYVYSVPMMAGRHGYWKAINAQKQAMSDLGGQLANLGRGAKAGRDVYKSLREKDTDKAVALAHGGDPIHDMIARLTNKDERTALMNMYETQHLHSAYDQSMFTGGGVDRTNVMMQQFTNAMEANNRLSTALAAYRVEKGLHGDHAGAQAYAQRVIEETHGLYSAGNTAPIFKNPLLRATLQFHQQPMNLAFMLYRNAYKAFKGDTEARWTLAYQLGTAAILGGMGGMPMDLPKLAGIATQPITGMAPSDWNDATVRELTNVLGPTGAHAIMEGLPGMMGPLGPSLGHRMGFDAGLLNDEPKSGSPDDIGAWAFKQLVGAPGGMIGNWLKGGAALESGDYQKAAENFLPGSLADFAKAYREATTGEAKGGKTIRDASYGDAILQTLGFTGVERERQMEGHYKLQEAIKAQDAAQKQTKGEQLKAKHAAKATVLGVPVNKKHAALESEYGSAYQ